MIYRKGMTYPDTWWTANPHNEGAKLVFLKDCEVFYIGEQRYVQAVDKEEGNVLDGNSFTTEGTAVDMHGVIFLEGQGS